MLKHVKLSIISFISWFVTATFSMAQSPVLESFPLSSVKLMESPFLKHQQTSMEYILALDPDKLLTPFRREAGIETNVDSYGNWESSGLDGHTGGHYLTALAQMLASTGNHKIGNRLDYMINQLDDCQRKNGNGYLGGIPNGQEVWQEIAQGRIEAQNFSLNGRWVPLYNLHKLFAGLRDAYLIAGNIKARSMLINLTDWFLEMVEDLSDDQIQEMLRSEHGGLNEVFADVADITGDSKYVELAKNFSDRTILDPLLERKDQFTGLHANTQIPKVVGFQRVAQVADDSEWQAAADFFWETIVDERSVSIGGNSVREHFHSKDDFSSMVTSVQGPETCNTYNMLRLSKLLFLSKPKAGYLDFYERGLYNHILSSQHPENGGYVYFTPMRPQHYRVYSQPQKAFWCCVGSGLENHGKYGELIYARQQDDLYVNLFIPSKLEWEEKSISLTQTTGFPFTEKSEIQLELRNPQRFTLHIRHPQWIQVQMKVEVNGELRAISDNPSSYLQINREWQNGDLVTIHLPMQVGKEYLPDNSNWVSFSYGPLVLGAATDSTYLQGLWADDSRMGHVADGKLFPLNKAPVLVAADGDYASKIKPVDRSALTFTIDEMIVSTAHPSSLLLKPFFQIHEARYMIYWPVAKPGKMDQRKEQLKMMDKDFLLFEAKIVDHIATGEQQPEAEHDFQGENTVTGMTNGKLYRETGGWFSYTLEDKNREGKVIMISYAGGDQSQAFDIILNDSRLQTVQFEEAKEENFDVYYRIPDHLLKKAGNQYTIKFEAHEGFKTSRVVDVFLLIEE